MPSAVIVLAAGQGTRMNSDLPKVLHPLAGAPLLAHALAAARAVEPERIVARRRPRRRGGRRRRARLDPELRVVAQAEQLGTGHAVLQAAPALAGFAGDVDRPLRRHPLHPPRDAPGDARRPRRRRRRRRPRLRGARPRRLRPAGPRRQRRPRGDRRGARTPPPRRAGDPPLQLRPDGRRRRARSSTSSPRSATTTPRANTT